MKLYSSKIKKIDEVFGTTSSDKFKSSFLSCSNLEVKVKEIELDFNKIWSRQNPCKRSKFYIYSKAGDLKKIKNTKK